MRLFLLLFLSSSWVLAGEPKFRAVEIDNKIEIGYGVTVADVDGDHGARLRRVQPRVVVGRADPRARGAAQGRDEPVRHRWNPAGNRRVNAVLHRMAVTQLRCEPRAQAIFADARRRNHRDVELNLKFRGVRDADQGRVWNDIRRKMASMGSKSETGAMHDMYAQWADSLRQYRDAFRPIDGQVGALFLLAGLAFVVARRSVEASAQRVIDNPIKVTVVVAFIAIGAFFVNPDLWSPLVPAAVPAPEGNPSIWSEIGSALWAVVTAENTGQYGVGGIITAAATIFFAYIGFEAVSTAGAESKNPRRDMPIGILGSLIICTILYILTSAVLVGIVPYAQLNDPAPIAKAVNQIGLVWFAVLVKVGAIAGLSSVMLVLLYGQTRNPWKPENGSSGSSAGSSAAVAAGLVPFAIGSETLGSIVSPCTVCGVTGLRPTFGRVSRAGAMTLCWSLDKIGPIARSAPRGLCAPVRRPPPSCARWP